MGLTKRILWAVIGWTAGTIIKLWMNSLRRTLYFDDPRDNPLSDDCRANYILATWHESLMLGAYLLGTRRQYTIVSRSKDGDLAARLVEQVGLKALRGSSSRGAATVVRQFMRIAGEAKGRVHIVITTDGPRGPRRVLKNGVVFLSSATGMSILPTAIGYDRPWRLNSWDRFMLPRPFSEAAVVCGTPVKIEAGVSREQIEQHRQQVESQLLTLQQKAEGLAEGRLDPSNVQEPVHRAA